MLLTSAPEILDTAPCGYVAFRDDGRIILANTTLAEMLRTTPEEMAGASLDGILTVAARIFYQTHFFPLLKLHGHAEEIYLSLRARDGETVHVLTNAVRRDHEGEPRNECVFMRIRERQKYEDELLRAKKAAEEANRAKSTFLSMVSHDLRTPLNAVTGYADLLLLGIRGPVTPEQVKDLERIKYSSEFLLGLLNDILTFARLEAGQMALRLSPVPLLAVITEAETLLGPRFREAALQYSRSSIPDSVTVRADSDRLKQILLNLLTNAAKFTPAGGEIAVDYARAGDRVLVRVSDTGRGIPEDKIPTIFEPFVQVDQKYDARVEGGVGLGLSISRELARAMGGDLTVASAAGRGSIFTIELRGA